MSEEAATCNALMEAGLQKLHVRKPNASEARVVDLIDKIQKHFWERIIVHEHHQLVPKMNLGGYHVKSTAMVPEATQGRHVSRSFHTFEAIRSCEKKLNYGFLSPIFDSISKPGYASKFSTTSIHTFLKSPLKFPIYALGGITPNNINQAKNLGFGGAAVLGSIWQKEKVTDRVAQFKQMVNQL